MYKMRFIAKKKKKKKIQNNFPLKMEKMINFEFCIQIIPVIMHEF